MAPNYDLEKLIDPLAVISRILFNRLKTMECNQCEPCGAEFMKALKSIESLGNAGGELKSGAAARE
jgi:hypothetical protein